MLERVPDDKYLVLIASPESKVLQQMAIHVAELLFQVFMTLTSGELDFASNLY